jgi:hypothetical protein
MQSYGEENVAAKTKDPINMKRPRFGIFSHLNPDLLQDTTKLYGFFPVVIESFNILLLLVGNEIKKDNTNFRHAVSRVERLGIFTGKILFNILYFILKYYCLTAAKLK